MDRQFAIGDRVVLANLDGDKDFLNGTEGEIVGVFWPEYAFPLYQIIINKQNAGESFISYYDEHFGWYHRFNEIENVYLEVHPKYLEPVFELPEIRVSNVDKLFK